MALGLADFGGEKSPTLALRCNKGAHFSPKRGMVETYAATHNPAVAVTTSSAMDGYQKSAHR
jgi:hypothetical protein